MNLNNLIKGFKKAIKHGFVHIFSSTLVNKILALLTSVVIVRLLNKNDFGSFSYAFNIITLVVIFSSMGTPISKMQYVLENDDPSLKKSISKYLSFYGLLSNFIIIILVIIFLPVFPVSVPGSKYAILLMALLPLFQFLYEIITYDLRIQKRNKTYAMMTNIQTASYFMFACLGAYMFGIVGTIVGRYIGFLIAIIFGLIVNWNYFIEVVKAPMIKFKSGFKYLKYGLTVMLTNAISSLLYKLDIFVVGIITLNTISIASYRAATIIPTALIFIPTSLMIFVYPYFVENQNNIKWIRKNLKYMHIGMFLLAIIIAFFSIIFAPTIIKLVFGSDYLDSVLPFKILMISFVISASFRTISGQVLAMLHLVKINLIIGVIESTINIIIDIILVKAYGSIGAALATTIVVLISSSISTIYIYNYLNRRTVNEK